MLGATKVEYCQLTNSRSVKCYMIQETQLKKCQLIIMFACEF